MNLWTITQAGPASYATGGFVVTTSLATLTSLSIDVAAVGTLGCCTFDITLNSPGAGQATVKVMCNDYDKLTAIASPSSLPAGVSLQGASGGTLVASTHTHAIDHNHASAASGGPTGGAGGVFTTVGSGNYSTHTHGFDPPALTGTSGAEVAHTHTWNTLYDHAPALTNTTTNLTAVEMANATDLSTASLILTATDT